MLFNVLENYKGNVKETFEVPGHLLPHAIKHAEPRYLKFDEGEVLTQKIEGRFFKLWEHRIKTREDICLTASTSELCITINYNRKGSVRCTLVGFGTVDLEEGTYHLFCVPVGMMHPCYFKPGGYVCIHLDLSEEWLYHIDFNPYCKDDLNAYLNDPANNGKQFKACTIQPIVQDVIRQITGCKIEDREEFIVFVTHEVVRFLREFNRQMPRLKEETEEKDYKAKVLDAYKTYVANNLGGDLGSDTLCRELLVSGITLYRYVKTGLWMAPFTYVQHERMFQAKRMLLDTALSIAEISEALGYAQPPNFTKAYKHYWDIGPSEERRG